MPKAGEPRLMPDGFGEPWSAEDVEMYRLAVLWLVLREHVPNTGDKVEDVLPRQSTWGDVHGRSRRPAGRDRARATRPASLRAAAVQMMVAADRAPYLLDPDNAVGINEGEMYRLARGSCPEGFGDDTIYVPRIPRDAAEANAMMQSFTILSNADKPLEPPKLYAGYSEAELLRGGVGVAIR